MSPGAGRTPFIFTAARHLVGRRPSSRAARSGRAVGPRGRVGRAVRVGLRGQAVRADRSGHAFGQGGLIGQAWSGDLVQRTDELDRVGWQQMVNIELQWPAIPAGELMQGRWTYTSFYQGIRRTVRRESMR